MIRSCINPACRSFGVSSVRCRTHSTRSPFDSEPVRFGVHLIPSPFDSEVIQFGVHLLRSLFGAETGLSLRPFDSESIRLGVNSSSHPFVVATIQCGIHSTPRPSRPFDTKSVFPIRSLVHLIPNRSCQRVHPSSSLFDANVYSILQPKAHSQSCHYNCTNDNNNRQTYQTNTKNNNQPPLHHENHHCHLRPIGRPLGQSVTPVAPTMGESVVGSVKLAYVGGT